MWPKALIELLPHLTKLVPVVNRYFQSRGANDDALRLALERKLDDVSRGLHNDVAESAAAGNEVRRLLKHQDEALTAIATDLRATHTSVEALSERILKLEQRVRLQGILITVLAILVALLALLRHR